MINDQDQQSPNQKPSRQLNKYARFSGIAFQMIAIIAIGAYAGVKLDKKYPNKYQAYTIVLSLLAVAMSMYYVIKQVNKPTKNNKS